MPGLTLQQATLDRAAKDVDSLTRQRPLRVCYLIDELATAGTETQLLALLSHINRQKVQPYLCLLRGNNALSKALEPADLPVLRLGVGSLLSPRTFAKAARFIRFLRREKIDVVQVYFPDSSYFGVPLSWLAGVPHRFRTRNNTGHWTTPLHRLLGRFLGLLTTCTLANCNAARESLLHDERTDPTAVRVLENGVDLERFAHIPDYQGVTENRPYRVGVVANLRRVKGLDVLVDAARILASRNLTFVVEIVGQGEERLSLQRQIDAAGLTTKVLLSGSRNDVPRFLSRLDVAVLSSRAEGLPNAVLEYMAAGRPVVATRVGATAELIDNGVHGLLVPSNDAPALAGAIERLMTDQGLAASCAAAGRDRAAGRYGRIAMIRRFEDFYDGLPRR